MGEEKGEKEEEGGEEEKEEEEGRGCIEGGRLGGEGCRRHPSLLDSAQLETGAVGIEWTSLWSPSRSLHRRRIHLAGVVGRERRKRRAVKENGKEIGWKRRGGGVVEVGGKRCDGRSEVVGDVVGGGMERTGDGSHSDETSDLHTVYSTPPPEVISGSDNAPTPPQRERYDSSPAPPIC